MASFFVIISRRILSDRSFLARTFFSTSACHVVCRGFPLLLLRHNPKLRATRETRWKKERSVAVECDPLHFILS